MRWLPRIRTRELSPSEAIEIGLTVHWIWRVTEIVWGDAGLVLWASPARPRYD